MNVYVIEYDDAKRRLVLAQRGLDFAEAGLVFAGKTVTVPDDRWDYGEPRYQTHGVLRGDVVMVVWTSRGDRRRIISMRRCHADERARYFARVGGP